MSRIRSQLDSLLQEPHPHHQERQASPGAAAEPGRGNPDAYREGRPGQDGQPAADASGAGAPTQSHELDRIRAIIEDLTGKIGTASAGRPAQQQPQPAARPAPQAAPAHTVEAPPARREAGLDIGSALSGEIRRQMNDELDGLRQQLGEVVNAIGQNRRDDGLQQEIHRVAEAVNRLEDQIAHAPDRLQDVTVELRHLRTAIAEYAGRPAPTVDLAGVTRSIEKSQGELFSRLETNIGSWLEQASQGRDDKQLHTQFGILSDHLGAMRDAIDKLPLNFPVTAVEARLEDIAGQINRLLGSNEGSLAHDFAAINERLDEITRAMVAISVNPGDDAFDRIEARLTTLAKSVETMAEDQRAASSESSQAIAGEIMAALQAIDGRLAEMGRETPASAEGLDAMTARLAFLSEKIDNLPALASAAADLGGDPELMAKLDAISARLDALGERAEQAGDRDNSEILAALQTLAQRIETLAGQQPAGLPDAAQIAGLEQQLAAILSQIGEISSSGLELGPITERLDNIEQQVASSRDAALDIASQAAERAVGLIQATPGIDADLIESLRLELKNLDNSSRDIGVRNADALHSVHEALIAIAERLGEIENRIATPRHAQPAPAVEAEAAGRTAEAPVRESAAEAPRAEPEAAPATVAAAAETRAGDELAELAERPEPAAEASDIFSADEEELPPIDDAPSLDARDLPPDEDVPLEPGSGTPDFVELVRQASAKRKSGDKAAHAHGTSDLIAAARRAAQAAAQQTTGATKEPAREETAPAASRKAFPGLKALLGKHRKAVLLASTAILVAMAAVPLASRFLAAPEQAAEAPAAPAVEEPAEAAAAPEAQTETAQQEAAATAETLDQAAISADTATETQSPPAAAEPTRSLAQAPATPAAATPGDDGDGDTVGDAPAAAPAEQEQASASAEAPAIAAKPVPGDDITSVPMPPAEAGNVALRQAAASGDDQALFEIARRYTDGDGVDRDLTKAAEWYEYSARAGLPLAQYRLANFFEKGHGVPVDLKKAVLWYERAAEQGNALAMHNLAVLYTSGVVGNKPDMKAAVKWFGKAAQLGVKDSQVNLGILSARGMGTQEDLVEAYKWFAVAARAGDQDAASKRDTLANAMRPDQLAKARGLAELWKPDPIDPAANSAEVKPVWTAKGSVSANAEPKSKETGAMQSARDLVAKAQQLLAKLGFDPGPADGLMGERTRNAVMNFQKNNGMAIDGEVTPDLIRALENGAA